MQPHTNDRQHNSRCERRNAHQHIAARVLPQQHRTKAAPGSGLPLPDNPVRCLHQCRKQQHTHSAQSADAAFLPSSGIFSYLPFDKLDPPCGIIHIGGSLLSGLLKSWVKSPFTYIGTKIRENSHPKCKNLQKNEGAAQKQLPRIGYSVILFVPCEVQTAFPPPPVAPAGNRRCTALRRRR